MKLSFCAKLSIIALAWLLPGCGGTFSLSPTGVVSYTTPRLINPQPEAAK